MKIVWTLIAAIGLSVLGASLHPVHTSQDWQLLAESGEKEEDKDDDEDSFVQATGSNHAVLQLAGSGKKDDDKRKNDARLS
jgi:hypothetical protein